MNGRRPAPWPERPPEPLEARLAVEPDGTIVVRSGKVEYGQNIRIGFAKIVAGELDVPLDRVRVELGETDRVPWDMGTFGSLSTATDGKSLRMAAAHARALLIERASRRFGVPASELDTRDGRVQARDGRSVAYEELTALEPLTGAVPETVTGRPPSAPEDAPGRLEALDIVTGRAQYPADVRLPGMLRGHVVHPLVPGSRLAAVDDREARAMPGVVAVVRDGDVVGVVAERDEQAQAAASALEVEWRPPDAASAEPFDGLLRNDEGAEEAFAGAAVRLDARYAVPHIAHASIGPSAAVADVREDGADLYVAVQRPFGLRDEAAGLLGLPPDRVHVHPRTMGGMYGRGNMSDAPMDAVRLSRAVRRPVLVQWTRTEEFRLSPHRPILDAELAAALAADGTIAAWRYHERTNPHTYGTGGGPARVIEMTSGRNAVPPYRLGRAVVRLQVVPGAVRTGAFRSLAAAPNVFAIESFIDELAHASQQDPMAFRLRLVDDPRLRRVLEAVGERSGWARRPREAGRGFGVACAVYHGTYVAEVAEVVVGPNGQVRIERVWCAVDPGRLVHPDGARNQIEGGVQQAASWALLEELHHDGSAVTTTSWRDYAIATVRDAPRAIDVVFTGDLAVASTGVGEPGSVPTAAAIANAVFDACGARVRRLPLTPAAVRRPRRADPRDIRRPPPLVRQNAARPIPTEAPVLLCLCGDVMTGRGVDQILPHAGDPRLHEPYVSDAREYVELADARSGRIPRPVSWAYVWGDALAERDRLASAAWIVNLETSITRADDVWRGKDVHYRMHPANVACLTAAGIDVCVLANNHVLDYGRDGLVETLDTLRQAGIAVAGAGRTRDEARRPAILERQDGRVVVFAFGVETSGIPPDWAATDRRPGVDLLDDLSPVTADAVARQVRLARQPGDVIVASIHWGPNWVDRIPDVHTRFAHALIDGGVHIVHGHSSHHPLAIEVYRGGLVLYGCRDFVDDYEGIAGDRSYRSDLVLMYAATVDARTGGLAAVHLTPLQLRRMRLGLASPADRQWLQRRLDAEGRRFGTRVEAAPDGRLAVRW